MSVLDDLNDELRKLRQAYEKYFAGIDRIQPADEHERFRKRLRQLRETRSANTAHRFRLNQLQASLVTHEAYWNRICRQIEEGTYKRDRLRAQRSPKSAPPAQEPASTGAAEEAPAAAQRPKSRPATGRPKTKPPAPRAAQTQAPAKPAVNAAMQRLHRAYTTAQAQVGQSQPVSMEALARTVAKQTAALRQRYNCQKVEFKVFIKDNRPILKAIPK